MPASIIRRLCRQLGSVVVDVDGVERLQRRFRGLEGLHGVALALQVSGGGLLPLPVNGLVDGHVVVAGATLRNIVNVIDDAWK